jgi:hypothetical protein
VSLSLIPAIVLLVIVLMSNPAHVDDKQSQKKHSLSQRIEKVEDPYMSIESPSFDNFDYQAILSYIKTKFSTIGEDDAADISKNLVDFGNEYDLDPKFAAAVIARESAFKKEAVSSTGAKGLGQIKDFNYPSLGISDPFNITENVRGTTKYLKEMLSNWQKTKENHTKKETEPEAKSYESMGQVEKVKLALASYYKGFTAVKNENGELDSKTEGYVGDILGFYDEIESIRISIEKEQPSEN